MRWSPVPLEALLDVEGIIDYWAKRGLVGHRTPALRPFPDLSLPELAYPQYPPAGLDKDRVTR